MTIGTARVASIGGAAALLIAGAASAEVIEGLGGETVLRAPAISAASFVQDETPVVEDAPPSYWEFHKWDGSVGLGLNGSTGNNERVNLRAGLDLKRTTDYLESIISFAYWYANEEAEVTEQAARAIWGNDFLFEDAPRWRAFTRVVYDYDEFQNYQHRISLRGGAGYTFIDREKHVLIGRVGAGATKNLRGDELAWRPELIVGADYTWDISEKQDFEAHTDFFLDVDEAGETRVESTAEWRVLLDEETNLNLVVGALHRYDTQPGSDTNRSDLDYYVQLAWTF
ncbi:MAG: DUF481 domain-containing protein [Planctomycetota bacterium]